MLVTLILFGRFVQLAIGLSDHDQPDQNDRSQRQQTEHITADGVEGAPTRQVLEPVGQVRGFVQQGLRQAEDAAGGFADLEQLRRGFEDLVDGAGNELEEFGNLAEAGAGILVFDLGNLQRGIALQHAIEYLAEAGRIASEGVGGLGRVFVAGQHGVHRTENAFGEQRLTLGHGYLGRRRATLQEDLHDLLVFHLQLRHGFSQGRRHLVQGQHGLFAGENRVRVFQQVFPVLLHRMHFITHGRRCGGQAPTLGEIVARIAEQLECRGLAGGGFGGVLGDALGQHAQLAGVADVLLVVGGLGVEIREIGEQQHDEHDQCDKQHDDLRTAARGLFGVAGITFDHLRPLPVRLWKQAPRKPDT